MTAAPHLRLCDDIDPRGYLPVATTLVRRFLAMPDDEPTELTFFYEGRIHVAQATDAEQHARLLREAQKRRGFTAAYMLVNGPLNPAIFARYEPDTIVKGWNGRASDADILKRRALFCDVDPKRPKGISATDDEKAEAAEVSDRLESWLRAEVGRNAVARGDSGNGCFLLVALEPRDVVKDDVPRISNLLRLLNKKFGTERVKIDESVFNAARLMPAPGTWKRKGRDTAERPHRQTSFCPPATIERVPMEVLC